MRVTTITITKSRTVNIGNFESVKVEFGASAELDYGDGYTDCVRQLEDLVTQELQSRCPPSAATIKEAGVPARVEPVYLAPTQETVAARTEAVAAEMYGYAHNHPDYTGPMQAVNHNHPPMAHQGPLNPMLPEDKPKRTRRTKAQIEADAVAAFQAQQRPAAPQHERLQLAPDGLADFRTGAIPPSGMAAGRQPSSGYIPNPPIPAQPAGYGATETQPTYADLATAAMAYTRAHGSQAWLQLLQGIAGTVSLPSVPKDRYSAVYNAATAQ